MRNHPLAAYDCDKCGTRHRNWEIEGNKGLCPTCSTSDPVEQFPDEEPGTYWSSLMHRYVDDWSLNQSERALARLEVLIDLVRQMAKDY
jgi:hypothetical protein